MQLDRHEAWRFLLAGGIAGAGEWGFTRGWASPLRFACLDFSGPCCSWSLGVLGIFGMFRPVKGIL